MPRLPRQTYDWGLIKRLYTEGKTAYEIAQLDGMPTKQAIQYRAREWQQEKSEAKAILPNLAGDDSKAATIARILGHLRCGLTHRLACAREGVSESAWRLWRSQDEILSARAEQAMADFIASKVEQIDRAGETDWKAAAWIVDRHPSAKEELKTREPKEADKGLTVILNIDRAKATVSDDGKTLTVDSREAQDVPSLPPANTSP